MEEPSVHSSISDINSEEPANSRAALPDQPRKKRICLVGEARNDPIIGAAAQKFCVPVITSETGVEYTHDVSVFSTYFILLKFEGPIYRKGEKEKWHKKRYRILGPTALLQLVNRGERLPCIHRPMYTRSLLGSVIVFTGFRCKVELTSLILKIHNMGGSIKQDMNAEVTHLIAKRCQSKKYKYAVTFRVLIMSKNWIDDLWEHRDNPEIYGNNEALILKNKLPPFFNSKICFFGFPEEEKKHMVEVLQQQGGDPVEIDNQDCTHVVVDESNSNVLSDLAKTDLLTRHLKTPDPRPPEQVVKTPDPRPPVQVVKAEWFWTSVQNQGAADEAEYQVNLESIMSPSSIARRDSQQTSTPTSASTKRKRKRFTENFTSLIQGAESPVVYKRRSSISDAGLLSVSGSFLDSPSAPDNHNMLDDIPEVEAANTGTPRMTLTRRHLVFLELLNTEKNYVEILNAIITFKSQLENFIDTADELLNATECKLIFGNLSLIHDVHKEMLEKFRSLGSNWREDASIGDIFLPFMSELVKAYPPYINFLGNAYETLKKWDEERPRFHAFLKICQSKPQSQRQPLHELIMRPAQRLGSTILLLEEIHRHTNINNPDHKSLELAVAGLKHATSHVNEDKRKTEGQLSIFLVFNDIDNCPPHLVSSHRSFIAKYEVTELSDGLSGRGDHLVLFLFSDTLEICKKRSKFSSLKSPNVINAANTMPSSKLHQEKPYKHITMLSLRDIKKIIDIQENDGGSKAFALKVRNNQELKERLFSFTLNDEKSSKSTFLKCLSRQMANTICIADADIFVITLCSRDLGIDTSDVSSGTFSKAVKFASRTKMKVGRALSFSNKTPNKFKRAMSSVMSPFGSTTSLTPTSRQLSEMRLASCNNINVS